jgi:hypothetical protein
VVSKRHPASIREGREMLRSTLGELGVKGLRRAFGAKSFRLTLRGARFAATCGEGLAGGPVFGGRLALATGKQEHAKSMQRATCFARGPRAPLHLTSAFHWHPGSRVSLAQQPSRHRASTAWAGEEAQRAGAFRFKWLRLGRKHGQDRVPGPPIFISSWLSPPCGQHVQDPRPCLSQELQQAGNRSSHAHPP